MLTIKAHDRNVRLASIKLKGHFETNAPEVHMKFQLAATRKYQLTGTDWQDLYEAVAQEDREFQEGISTRIKSLNKKKLNICYLLKLGFTTTKVQNVMNMPKSTAFHLVKDLTEQLGGLLDTPEQKAAQEQAYILCQSFIKRLI